MYPRCVLMCAGICLAVGPISGAGARPNLPDQQQGAPPATVVNIPTFHDGGQGMTRMRAGALTGKTIAAWRDNADLVGKNALALDPTPGYVLGSAVVIELANAEQIPDALRRAAATAGTTLVTDPNIPGIVIADSNAPAWTVQSGVNVALAARRIAGVRGAFLDMRVPLSPRTLPNDDLFLNQWHLHNTVNPLHDVNAAPAWDVGYTGAGVIVGIVDQGFAIAHPDLAAGYNATASQAGSTFDAHATGCAGIVGARANNTIGVAGLAYDSQISKLYYGSSTVNAAAFAFRNDLNDIKSNSWGPPDNGMISFMPANERNAITTAINTGREGLGEIFVWASGNGAASGDRADYDPYASSRFTIAVGAIDHTDVRSIYSEPGASLLCVAQSDRDINTSSDVGIWTTTISTGYTGTFGGTSAACPLAAGAVALMLDANPALGWRDVQHIIVRTARQCHPSSPTWTTNGAGFHVSHDYGFGAIDAAAACAMAATWTNVEPPLTSTSGVISVAQPIPNNNPAGLSSSFVLPTDVIMEHVEIQLSVTHPFIGDLRIAVTSPEGTESILALPRNDSTDNYNNYVLTSVRHWGEHASGTWTLRIIDAMPSDSGTWNSWRITAYGTTPPCPADYNLDGTWNSQDFFDFLNDFFSGQADFNRDGATDSQDFFDFCGAFFTGC